jgi:hypothetical protein
VLKVIGGPFSSFLAVVPYVDVRRDFVSDERSLAVNRDDTLFGGEGSFSFFSFSLSVVLPMLVYALV